MRKFHLRNAWKVRRSLFILASGGIDGPPYPSPTINKIHYFSRNGKHKTIFCFIKYKREMWNLSQRNWYRGSKREQNAYATVKCLWKIYERSKYAAIILIVVPFMSFSVSYLVHSRIHTGALPYKCSGSYIALLVYFYYHSHHLI